MTCEDCARPEVSFLVPTAPKYHTKDPFTPIAYLLKWDHRGEDFLGLDFKDNTRGQDGVNKKLWTTDQVLAIIGYVCASGFIKEAMKEWEDDYG